MSFTNLKKRTEGFTIIEVLIVLAIAGLILLIVFLAVPALQRNGRNTQRKNDVAALLAGVSEFGNNNSGKLPNTCSGTSPVKFDTTPTAGTTSEVKVGYYKNAACATSGTASGTVVLSVGFSAQGPFNTAAQDYVVIVPAATCSTATTGLTVAGAARQFAAVYEIENGSGSYAPVCQES